MNAIRTVTLKKDDRTTKQQKKFLVRDKEPKYQCGFKTLKLKSPYVLYLKHRYGCRRTPQILIKAPGCYISTFKKKLFNSVMMVDGRFVPGYNRRKHGHSHALTVTHHQRQYSKTFGYVNRNKIQYLAGLSLKLTVNNFNIIRGFDHASRMQSLLRCKTTLNVLMEKIETESQVMLQRNMWVYGPYQSKHTVNHGKKRAITLGSALSHAYYYGLNITSSYIGVDAEAHAWLRRGETYRYNFKI